MLVEAADRMEIEYQFANDISDELLMSAVERMESTDVVQDSDEILAEAADRMEIEFLFSERIPEEILINVAEQLESARAPETAIEGEPNSNPQHSSTPFSQILPPEPQASTSWANVDQPLIGSHSELHQLDQAALENDPDLHDLPGILVRFIYWNFLSLLIIINISQTDCRVSGADAT